MWRAPRLLVKPTNVFCAGWPQNVFGDTHTLRADTPSEGNLPTPESKLGDGSDAHLLTHSPTFIIRLPHLYPPPRGE